MQSNATTYPNDLSNLIEAAEKACKDDPTDAKFDNIRFALQPFLRQREAQRNMEQTNETSE